MRNKVQLEDISVGIPSNYGKNSHAYGRVQPGLAQRYATRAKIAAHFLASVLYAPVVTGQLKAGSLKVLECCLSVEFVESCQLPTRWGEFVLYGFEDRQAGKEHLVLAMGDVSDGEPVLARLHSECLTGDVLHSQRCDCGSQLEHAMQAIAKEGRGLMLYLRQEGRGIGLLNKIRAYKLQEAGADTVEANEHLGFGADLRDYSICKAMLEYLGVKRLRLLTNNPKKIAALEEMGFEVAERLPVHTGRNAHNQKYLETKQGKLGHFLQGSE